MSDRKYGISFQDDIRLDKLNLAEEAEANPSLIQFYSEELAKAKNAKDAAENHVKILEAEKELMYRSNPPPDLKITEAVIASLVATDPEVVEAKAALVEAKKDVYIYDMAVSALNDKSAMIRSLVELFKSGYYSV